MTGALANGRALRDDGDVVIDRARGDLRGPLPRVWILCVAVAIAAPAAAQSGVDSVVVVAGPRYEAGSAKRFWLGSGYRDLWLRNIRVPVLRPDTAAGGLTVVRRGNSEQTLSLLFVGADGTQYFFRSVDKEQEPGLPPDLHRTFTSYIIQDRVSAKHPGAALVVAPLLGAAGVPHPTPRLAVMADHPGLGEHRVEFAGRLGMLEERPEEGDGGGGFGGFERIIGADRLLERLEESPADRVDARAYLTARLVDFVVGDWDRHPDQWRWAENERGGTRYWLPIPRDRDNAFSHMDGVISVVAELLRSTITRFDARYDNLYGLVHNAQPIDRRVLPELTPEVWDSAARTVRARLTDEVIDGAVTRLPAEWAATEAGPLAAALRARRDALPAVAREIYVMMSREVDVHGTDEADSAVVERLGDGSTRVRLSAKGDHGRVVYFDRVLEPGETSEVRVHLHGGDDAAVVRGPGGGIDVRVIGGGGDDVLRDESAPGGDAFVAFHDSRGENTFVGNGGTRVDERPWEPPETSEIAEGNAPPPRDWGRELSPFRPVARWPSEIGPVIGGGPAWTRYGFRRVPYASRVALALVYAPLHGRFGLEAGARSLRTGGGGEARLNARVSGISATRFHGFGNDTPDGDDRLVWASELALEGLLIEEVGRGLELRFEPRIAHLMPDPVAGTPARAPGVPGGDSFGVVGTGIGLEFDRRDSDVYPTRGFRADLHATPYPLTWGDAEEPFVNLGATAAGYLPLSAAYETTLAARVGAERVLGGAPFQFSPAVGGGSTLRGHRTRRFTGDAAVHASVELRANFGRANLFIARPEVGGILLFDVGRVFVSGEDSNRWHTGYGGGVSVALFERTVVGNLLFARGEDNLLHAGVGLPF